MSQSYQAMDSRVYGYQLAVQELTLKLADNEVLSASGSVATINVYKDIGSIVNVLFVDDSAGTCAPVAVANQSISDGSLAILNLSATLAAADSIIFKFKY